MHVGDVENVALRGDADVLGHAAAGQLEIAEHAATDHVDLHQCAAELAGENCIAAVDGKVRVIEAAALGRRHREFELHGMGIAEVEAPPLLRHHDGEAAVGGEVEVIGIVNPDRCARQAGGWIDRRDGAVGPAAARAGDPQRLEVV
jgi:hypothetical protein